MRVKGVGEVRMRTKWRTKWRGFRGNEGSGEEW